MKTNQDGNEMEKTQANYLNKADQIVAPYLELFQNFNENGILWCSWKSNEHLEEGLDGRTDIDILFDKNDKIRVIKTLHDCGFILFEPPSYRRYPGIIDAINIDIHSGKILHAHSHFLFTLGEKHLKSSILPWDENILKRRVKSEISKDIYISNPIDEIILLLVREALKIRYRDLFFKNKKNKIGSSKDFFKEFKWLEERTSPKEIRDCACGILDENISNIIYKIMIDGINVEYLLDLRKSVKILALQNEWRRLPEGTAILSAWWREVVDILIRISTKLNLFKNAIIRRRTIVGDGMIIAFLGADGSGKSTVTQRLISDWSNKIDVSRIYLGTGDGQKALSQIFINSLFSLVAFVKKLRKIKTNAEKKEALCRKSQRDISLSTILQAIVGANVKAKQMKYIQKLKSKGFMVICDRWPQNQNPGINDGPLLSSLKNSKNYLYKFLAHWEEKKFKKICSIQKPDIVIKLVTSPKISVSRKEENKNIKDLIKKKIEVVKSLQFDSDVNCRVIDAGKSLDEVLTEARDIIWKHLQTRNIINNGFYECLGLPGAGKTTLCNELYGRNKIKSISDVFASGKKENILNKIILSIKSIFTDFPIYIYALRISFKYKLWNNYESLSYIFKIPVQKLRAKKATSNEKYLFEQFLLQNIWSAFVLADVRRVNPADLSPLINAIYNKMNVEILFFDITAQEACERIRNRTEGTSRFDDLNKEELIKKLERFLSLINDIKKASLYAGLNIIEIDASQNIDEIISTNPSNIQIF